MLDKILRALILLSAGVTVVCRYVAFKSAESLGADTVKLLNVIAVISVIILVISGTAFAVLVKKAEKTQKLQEKADGGDGKNA